MNLMTLNLPHQHKADEGNIMEEAFNPNLNISTPFPLPVTCMGEDYLSIVNRKMLAEALSPRL